RRDQVRADASLCGGNSAASERRGMAREIQFTVDPGDRLKDDPAVLAGGSKPDGGGVQRRACEPGPRFYLIPPVCSDDAFLMHILLLPKMRVQNDGLRLCAGQHQWPDLSQPGWAAPCRGCSQGLRRENERRSDGSV